MRRALLDPLQWLMLWRLRQDGRPPWLLENEDMFLTVPEVAFLMQRSVDRVHTPGFYLEWASTWIVRYESDYIAPCYRTGHGHSWSADLPPWQQKPRVDYEYTDTLDQARMAAAEHVWWYATAVTTDENKLRPLLETCIHTYVRALPARIWLDWINQRRSPCTTM